MAATAKQPRVLPPETREVLVKLIAQSDRPMSAKHCAEQLTGPFKASDKLIAPVLEEFVATGQLRSYPPPRGKAPCYWDRGIEVLARSIMLEVLHTAGPLKPADLKKKVLGTAKGLSDAAYQDELKQHLAAGRIFEHPAASRRATLKPLHIAPPDPAPYLKEVSKEFRRIMEMLGAAGVASAALQQSGLDMLSEAGLDVPAAHDSVPESTVATSPDVDLIALMRSIEPGADRGALVTLPELRRAAGIEREAFDKAVLALAGSGRVALHRHDFPSNLPPAERDALVTDGRGNFFVGINLRWDRAEN